MKITNHFISHETCLHFLQNDLCHPDGIVKYFSFLANTIAHAGEN